MNITINGRPVAETRSRLTYVDIVKLVRPGLDDDGAINAPIHSITYSYKHKEFSHTGTVRPGTDVEVVDGLRLDACVTDRA